MKKNLLFIIVLILFISVVLISCSSQEVAHEKYLRAKDDISQLHFIQGEASLDDLVFEFFDENGNKTNLKGRDLAISDDDSLKLLAPGFHNIKMKYQGAEISISILIKEREQKIEHKLIFKANGGIFSNANKDTIEVQSGETLMSYPEIPTRNEYVFEGFYPNQLFISEERVVVPYEIKSEKTFYAKWSSDTKYTVMYKKSIDNQQTPTNIPRITEMNIAENEEIFILPRNRFEDYNVIEPKEDYEKYNFIGYKIIKKNNLTLPEIENYPATYNEPIKVDSNLEIILLFETKVFKIQFLEEDGSIIKSMTRNFGMDILDNDIPNLPAVEGKDGKWYNETANKDFLKQDIKNIKRNIIIRAKRSVIRVKVNFINDNYNLSDLSTYYDYGSSIGANKTIPHRNGFIGSWLIPTSNMPNQKYSPSELANIVLNINLDANIAVRKSIDIKTFYDKKSYKLVFNFEYLLPSITKQTYIYNDELLYGERLNLDIKIRSKIFAPRYECDGQIYYGYDWDLYNTSTWHYSQDKNDSTVVAREDILDDKNSKLSSYDWNSDHLAFYFNAKRKFSRENIMFSSPQFNPEYDDTKYINVDPLIECSIKQTRDSASIEITNLNNFMKNYPSKSIVSWEYNQLYVEIDGITKPVVPTPYNSDYEYYKDDVIYVCDNVGVPVFYKSKEKNRDKNPADSANSSVWDSISPIRQLQQIDISNNTHSFIIDKKHIFNNNVFLDTSIRPKFIDRKFTVKIMNQTFITLPETNEDAYVYNYKYNVEIYNNASLSYKEMFNLADSFNEANHIPEYESGDTGNFTFVGMYENMEFNSRVYKADAKIEIVDDIVLYAKWIDLNYGSEELRFKIDNNGVSVNDFVLNVLDPLEKISLSIVIPNSWGENNHVNNHVKSIEGCAFDKLLNYSNITIEEIVLPTYLETIKDDALKNLKNLKSIKIDPENQFFAISEEILYSKDKKTIIKVSSLNEINDFATVINNVERISNYAFSNYDFEYELDLSNSSLIHIGKGSFFANKGLTKLTLKDTLLSVDDEAFASCSNLSEIVGNQFSENLSFGLNVFNKTAWFNSKRDETIIKLGNLLIQYKIDPNSSNIQTDDSISIIAKNCFYINESQNMETENITILFSKTSKIRYLGESVFSNIANLNVVIAKLAEEEVDFHTSALNGVNTLSVPNDKISLYQSKVASLENNDVTILPILE